VFDFRSGLLVGAFLAENLSHPTQSQAEIRLQFLYLASDGQRQIVLTPP
jgi:hypothetical protein